MSSRNYSGFVGSGGTSWQYYNAVPYFYYTSTSGIDAYFAGLTNDNLIPSASTINSITLNYYFSGNSGSTGFYAATRIGSGLPKYSPLIQSSGTGAYSYTFTTDANNAAWTLSSIFNDLMGFSSFTTSGQQIDIYVNTGTGTYDFWLTINFSLPAPTVTTTAATSIGATTATLNGTLNPNGANSTYPDSYYFNYGPTASYGNTTTAVGNNTGSGNISAFTNISGLAANTTYHYQLVGTNTDNTINGSDMTFTTTATGDLVLLIF